MNTKTTRRPVESRRPTTCLIESLESRELFAISQPLTPPNLELSSGGAGATLNPAISMQNIQSPGASFDKLDVSSI
jgi:hypothetical protein